MIPVTFFDSFYRLGSLYGEFDARWTFDKNDHAEHMEARAVHNPEKFLGLRGHNSQTEGVRVNLPETFIVDLVSVFQTHHRSRDSHQK